MWNELLPGERLDDLQRNGLKLIQHPKSYRFGMDSVLLADFVRLRPRDRVLDMGAGTGVLSVLLADSYPEAKVTALEIQPELADMIRRSVRYNALEARVDVALMDLNRAPERFGPRSFDAVVCNPPYKKRESGLKSASDALRIARYELLCTFEDVAMAAAALLSPRGKLFFCQRAERLAELMPALERHKLSPKLLRFVHPKPHSGANLVLVSATLGASPSFLTVMPPLVVYDESGNETDELRRIYGKGTEDALF